MHPVHILDEEDFLLVGLWQSCRGGTVTGRSGGMAPGMIASDPIGGHLPEAGGVLDQANCTMESLAVIETVHQALQIKPGERED